MEYMYPQYMYILLYVTLMWCNRYCYRSIVNWSVGGVTCIISVYAFCYMCNLLWCNGIPQMYCQLEWEV